MLVPCSLFPPFFCNTMPRRDPVGVIRQTSRSGSGADDGLEFIRCVDGRQPQIHKLWSFAEDGITREVHPFLQIDVGDFSGNCFQTDYTTEIGCTVAIYGWKSINESVECLNVPAPFYGTGVAWIENILVPSPRWGDGVTYATWTVGTQSGVLIIADVPWRSVVPVRQTYLTRSPPENARATARCVRDACLWENCLGRAQNVLYAHHIGGDGQVYWSDDDWDDIWDEPADQ